MAKQQCLMREYVPLDRYHAVKVWIPCLIRAEGETFAKATGTGEHIDHGESCAAPRLIMLDPNRARPCWKFFESRINREDADVQPPVLASSAAEANDSLRNSSTLTTTTTGLPCFSTWTGSALARSSKSPNLFFASLADMVSMLFKPMRRSHFSYFNYYYYHDQYRWILKQIR